jgi:hypothetical protein
VTSSRTCDVALGVTGVESPTRIDMRWKVEVDPATAKAIGIRKSRSTRVNSIMSTIAVRGIFIEEARNAVALTTANAPGALPGQIEFQIPPIKVASGTPIATLGVKTPPWATARSAPIVANVLRTTRVAATSTVKLLSKP